MKTLKRKNRILSVISSTLLLFLFSAGQALASCDMVLVPCGRRTGVGCGFCDIFQLINNIVTYILTCIAPILATLMLVFGGLYMLAARGNPATLNKAKGIITAAVTGLIIIFIAWVFLNSILDYMGVAEWTGLENWWQINCH